MGLVVLGMHRSGTSLLIGLLQVCGYNLGKVSEKTSQYKPTGTRENLELRRINNEILHYNNCSWNMPIEDLKINQELVLKMKSFCSRHLSGKWAIKDPRMILTYSIWQEYLPGHKVLATVRHPLNVANSLSLKSKVNIQKGVDLWSFYNSILFKLWHKRSFPIINFDLSKDDYLLQLSKWENYLSIKIDKSDFSTFYSHSSPNIGNTEQTLDDYTMKLYKQMTSLTVQNNV